MRLLSVFLLVIAGQLSLASEFSDHFNGDVLRVDYFRTGNHQEAKISLHQVMVETPWSGSRTQLVDNFFFGEYRIEMWDELNQQILFSKGYSSLFREWQTTDEAKSTMVRSYPESVHMPFPKHRVNIVFLARQGQGEWKEEFILTVDPSDPYIMDRRDSKRDYFRIHESGDPSHCLDLVILAEGYTMDQVALFRQDASRFAGYLLQARPFPDFRNQINIHAVFEPSADEGTDAPGRGEWKNTVLNTRFYTFQSDRYLTTSDYHLVADMASGVPWDQVLILVNTREYGGGGIYNFYSVCSARHPLSDFVFIHEFGHAFAGLGDEYYTSDVAYSDFYSLNIEPWEPNLTTLVDFERKWKDMLLPETPVPTPATSAFENHIGVFEGGGYLTKGIYRPAMDCTMKSARYDNFCPVCQRAIRRMMQTQLK